MPLTVGEFTFGGMTRRLLAELNDDGSVGRHVILRGFNISGSAKTIGVPCSSEPEGIVARATQFLPTLRDDGFDLLRVPVVWEYLQPRGPGDWNNDVANALRKFVEYAVDLGFWIIIDVHQDVLGSFFRSASDAESRGDGLPEWLIRAAYGDFGAPLRPEWKDQILWVKSWSLNYALNGTMQRAMANLSRPPVLDAFTNFARKLSELFDGLDNILTYEVLNEPYSEYFSADTHRVLAEAFRAGLGSVVSPLSTPTMSVMPAGNWLNTTANLLLNGEHPQVNFDPNDMAKKSSLPNGNLQAFSPDLWLLTPHFYDPRAGAPDVPAEPHKYAGGVAAAEQLIAKWNVAPLVGEFGCPSDEMQRDDCHRTWVNEFERRGWSWCHWNFNPDSTGEDGNDHWCGEKYSVGYKLNENQVERSPAYHALLRPFIRRCGGPLLNTSWDARRGIFVVEIGPAYQPGWQTEITIPAGLKRFAVTGDGCTFAGRTVLVDTDGVKRTVTIDVWA